MSERIQKLLAFLENSPNDNFLIHALALEYAKKGDFDTAKHYYETNIRLSPQYVASYYHLGKLFEKQGMDEDAIAAYTQGMQIAREVNDQHAYSELRSALEELTF